MIASTAGILSVSLTDVTNWSQYIFLLCPVQSHCFSIQGFKKPLLIDLRWTETHYCWSRVCLCYFSEKLILADKRMKGKAEEMLSVWKASWIGQLVHSVASGQGHIQSHGLRMISSLAVFHQLRFGGRVHQNHLGDIVGTCASLKTYWIQNLWIWSQVHCIGTSIQVCRSHSNVGEPLPYGDLGSSLSSCHSLGPIPYLSLSFLVLRRNNNICAVYVIGQPWSSLETPENTLRQSDCYKHGVYCCPPIKLGGELGYIFKSLFKLYQEPVIY